MRIISGFMEPTSGQAWIDGHDSHTDPIAARRHLGYLPEGAPAYADMTVAGFLEFIAAMHGMEKSKANARLAELIDRVDLAEVWNQRIESLSKGFKRRVAIAQALVHDPAALILDEPTDGLDPIQKYEMRDLIRSIAPKKAIIISTHILEEVEAVCSRAIIIAKGRLLADATPAELLARAPGNGTLALALSTGDPQRAIDILSKHPAVGHVDVVQRVNGVTRIAVRIAKSQPSPDEITSLLGRSNVAVTEFYMERAKLDDVFRQITGHGAEN
jgi:ABC-2 type transport system ATP-binding protein